MRTLIQLLAALPLIALTELHASQVRFEFTGFVSTSISAPYGIAISNGSPVLGRFAYNPNASATHAFPNASGYRQQIAGGFFASIGGASVVADEYIVEVSDNVPQSGGTFADAIAISFDGQLNPPLLAPLLVNGTSQTQGLFRINFAGPSSAFSNTQIPSTIQGNLFPTKLGFFSDASSPVVDVFFVITTLRSVPEPSTMAMVLLAVPVLVLIRVVCRGNSPHAIEAQRDQAS